jgi:DNA-binding transcriptional ArsR family regulator
MNPAGQGVTGRRRSGPVTPGSSSTTELAAQLGVTRSAVSQHLQVLAAAGLVHRARAGRTVLYRQSALGTQLAGHHNL